LTLDRRYLERLDRLRKEMIERGIEHLWVEPSVGFLYLTGLEPISIERLTGLLIPAQGEMRLLVPLMLAEECEFIGADAVTWDDTSGPDEATARVLSGISTLHIQGSLPSWALFALRSAAPSTSIELDPGTLERLREIKDPAEIETLRASGEVTDGMIEWIEKLGPVGLTERALGTRIQARYLELGVVPTDSPLVASGANAAMPHHAGGDLPIDPSAPLLIDIMCRLDGYWSDITRVLFPERTDPEIMESFEIVCAAYDAAFAAVAVGVLCSDVDAAARSVIERAGLGERFLHRTGHGLGLEMHEAPYIRGGNDQPLEVGHVFSIEPGVYIPGRYGLRFENSVALTANGPLELNRSARRHVLQG
jgi:Xaa-Pro aminopeptidase